MKNIVKSVLVLFGALVVSCSTDDVQDRPVIEGVDSPVLSAPESESSYTLLPANMMQQAERFVWSKANYNGDVAINYTLEIDVEGGDFSAPESLGGTTGALQLSVSQETLNIACLNLGATPYSPASFDVRVVSSATGFDLMGSNKVTITVTPFSTDLPKSYIIGNFLNASGYGSDWTPAASLPAIASSGFGKTNFEGYVYMNVPSPEFKVLPTNTSFDGDFGDDGNFTGDLIQNNESNISITGAGYYWIKANTGAVSMANPNGLKYSVTPISTWGIIGSATPNGWGSSTPMTYNQTSKKWSVVITLVDGEFKFRSNDTWNAGSVQYNLGGFQADKVGDDYAGEDMSYGGANIAATAGTYLVELDLSNPRAYTYTLTPQ